MKHILLTGVSGFICSNVCNYLTEKYPDLFFLGVDKLTYCSSQKNIAPSLARINFKFIKADICNLEFMDHLFKEYHIDTVMHFAAYSHVDASFGNSLEFTYNNVVGTHVLLEVAKQNNVGRIIIVSSDETVGDSDSIKQENSMLLPNNPYSASKACTELIARSYQMSFKSPIIITRSSNVYGTGQHWEKVIPRFCQLLHQNKPLTIQGSGTQRRCFIHVEDISRAFEKILFQGEIGEIYNIGTDTEISILELAHKLIELHGGIGSIEYIRDRDFNDQRYLLSKDKIEALGWKQEVDFDTGLKQTFEWYANHMDYWD